ncbi:MAG: hypothetical protein LBD85_01530 [Oscillospiraceae bacterium]|nr:hypothetical protein [Oscillospiraceae bacterium]
MKTTLIRKTQSLPVKLIVSPKTHSAKTLLLVALIVSGVILGYLTGAFTDIVKPESELPDTSHAVGKFTSLARPYAILISGTAGERGGAVYDANGLSAAWNASYLALSETLGTAGDAISVREDEFRAAVSSEGVVFAYRFPLQLDALLNWLGVTGTVSFETAADIICLSACGDFANSAENYTLYYRTEDGRFFKRDGVSSIDGHMGDLSAPLLPTAYFAFENPENRLTDIYTILPDKLPQLNELNIKIPQITSVRIREILSTLEMNPYNSSNYQENGAVTYTENNATLKIYDHGLIEYSAANEGYINLSGAESADLAYRVLTEITQSEELQLTEFTAADGKYEFRFEFIYGGIVISPGASAVVVVDGGRIRSLSVTLREYEASSEVGILLPPRQAAIAANSDAYSMEVVYAEQGNSAVPVWITRSDRRRNALTR